MKKFYFFIIALVGINSTSNAQISKGSTFTGGSVGFSNRKSEQTTTQQPSNVQESKETIWNFTPQLGKAIGENRILGIFFSVGGNNSELENNPNKMKSESSSYGGGVFYRRYYPVSQRFYLFGEADLGAFFGSGETTNNNGTTSFIAWKNDVRQFGVSIYPGVSFKATPKLFLEAALNNLFTLNYVSNESNDYNSQGVVTQTREEKSFAANANASGFSNLSVGFRWILPSSKK